MHAAASSNAPNGDLLSPAECCHSGLAGCGIAVTITILLPWAVPCVGPEVPLVEWVSGDLVQAPHPSLRLIEAGAALAAGRRVSGASPTIRAAGGSAVWPRPSWPVRPRPERFRAL